MNKLGRYKFFSSTMYRQTYIVIFNNIMLSPKLIHDSVLVIKKHWDQFVEFLAHFENLHLCLCEIIYKIIKLIVICSPPPPSVL